MIFLLPQSYSYEFLKFYFFLLCLLFVVEHIFLLVAWGNSLNSSEPAFSVTQSWYISIVVIHAMLCMFLVKALDRVFKVFLVVLAVNAQNWGMLLGRWEAQSLIVIFTVGTKMASKACHGFNFWIFSQELCFLLLDWNLDFLAFNSTKNSCKRGNLLIFSKPRHWTF